MFKCTLMVDKNVNVKRIISDEIRNLYSEEKVFFKAYNVVDKEICVFVAEDYSFSTNSSLTINLISEAHSNQTIVNVIVSGGKIGLLGIAYGSEKRRAKRITDILLKYGFHE